jgi:dihydrodipicolinate synthase/N-acetylneuraminate lyase
MTIMNMSKALNASATGVYLITVTPFTDSGALDLASTDSMVDFYLACGVTGLTVLGIMGEATKLTAQESSQSSLLVQPCASPGLNGHLPTGPTSCA